MTCGAVLAQEPAIEQPTTEPVAENPTTQTNSNPGTSQNQASSPGFENTPSSNPAPQSREESTDKNPEVEALNIASKDLIEQQRMADGTEGLVITSWWQVGIGIFGIVLLGFTLFYTHSAAVSTKKTLKAAETASDAADKTADATVKALQDGRAWIVPKKTGFEVKKGVLEYHICLENKGRSPATYVNLTHYQFLTDASVMDKHIHTKLPSDGGKLIRKEFMVDDDDSDPIRIPLDETKLVATIRERKKFFIYCIVEYGTVYQGVTGRTYFCHEIFHGSAVTTHQDASISDITKVIKTKKGWDKKKVEKTHKIE